MTFLLVAAAAMGGFSLGWQVRGMKPKNKPNGFPIHPIPGQYLLFKEIGPVEFIEIEWKGNNRIWKIKSVLHTYEFGLSACNEYYVKKLTELEYFYECEKFKAEKREIEAHKKAYLELNGE